MYSNKQKAIKIGLIFTKIWRAFWRDKFKNSNINIIRNVIINYVLHLAMTVMIFATYSEGFLLWSWKIESYFQPKYFPQCVLPIVGILFGIRLRPPCFPFVSIRNSMLHNKSYSQRCLLKAHKWMKDITLPPDCNCQHHSYPHAWASGAPDVMQKLVLCGLTFLRA